VAPHMQQRRWGRIINIGGLSGRRSGNISGLRNAAIVLANRGERRAVGALSRALGDEDAGVRRAAAWALEKLGASSAPGS